MASGRRTAGLLLAALGLAVLAFAALQGDLRAGLFLVIPYFYGTGLLPFLGFVLLMAGGFLALTAGLRPVAWEPAGDEETRPVGERPATKHGGFVLLGPIPIAWGNDRRMLPWLLLLGAAVFALMLALPLLLR